MGVDHTFGRCPPLARQYWSKIHSNVSVHSERTRQWPRIQLRFSPSTPIISSRGQPYLQLQSSVGISIAEKKPQRTLFFDGEARNAKLICKLLTCTRSSLYPSAHNLHIVGTSPVVRQCTSRHRPAVLGDRECTRRTCRAHFGC